MRKRAHARSYVNKFLLRKVVGMRRPCVERGDLLHLPIKHAWSDNREPRTIPFGISRTHQMPHSPSRAENGHCLIRPALVRRLKPL